MMNLSSGGNAVKFKSLALSLVLVASLAFGQAHAAEVTLRLGHQAPTSHPINLAAERFAELVAEKTNGEVKIDVFPGGQLGGMQALWTAVNTGTLDIAASISPSLIMDYVPEVSVFDAPYVFEDAEHFRNVWMGPIGRGLAEEILEVGSLRLLYMQAFGKRHLTANQPIHEPEDLAGIKLRAVTAPMFMDTIESMGATPTPVDFNETYQALQSGIIDGQENPVGIIDAMRFHEVQSHLMLTGHMLSVVTTLINEDVYRTLSPEHQQALIEAGWEAGPYGDEQAELLEIEASQRLMDAGMTFIGSEDGLDAEAFRSRVREAMVPKLNAQWRDGFLAEVEAAR
jgi:TRAP-type transport system periplasmic protein